MWRFIFYSKFQCALHFLVAFKIYDLDNDGKISKDDLMQVEISVLCNFLEGINFFSRILE